MPPKVRPKREPTEHEHREREEHEREKDARHTEEHIYDQIGDRLHTGETMRRTNRETERHLVEAGEASEMVEFAGSARSHVEEAESARSLDDPDPAVNHTCRNTAFALLGVFLAGSLALNGVLAALLAMDDAKATPPGEEPPDDEPWADIPADFRAKVEELKKNWQRLDDAVVWGSLIAFVTDEEPSLYRQRYVLWVLAAAAAGAGADATMLAEGQKQLHASWAAEGDLLALYRLASTLKVGRAELSRKQRLEVLYAFLTAEFFPEHPKG